MTSTTTAASRLAAVRSQVTSTEWEARVDLAACYRLIALFGMSDLIYNHATVRVPGTEDEFLINPYGYMYEEITASSLLKIDLQGRILFNPHEEYEINHAGYVVHSAVHAAREDARCVLHTHSRAGVAVSAQKNGVLPIVLPEQAAGLAHQLAAAGFEPVPVDLSELLKAGGGPKCCTLELR